MATRVIVSAAISTAQTNKYYYPGDTVEFTVSTDTGAADETMRPYAARLTLSRVRSYSKEYTLDVLFAGESIVCAASTDAMAVNTNTHAPTMELHSLDDALISQSPGTIVLEVVGDTDDNCINFREGCVLTLEIDYAPRPTLVPYTDPEIVAGQTAIKAAHITELQINTNQQRISRGLAEHAFTEIVAGITELSGWSAHISELRAAIDETGVEHDAWIDIPVNCPTAAVMMQLREVVASI